MVPHYRHHELPSIKYYRDSNITTHLALWKENCRLYGLTAWCDDEGIQGLEAHFEVNERSEQKLSQSIGMRVGNPKHVRFQEDEFLTHAWGFEGEDSMCHPVVQILVRCPEIC